MSTSQDYLENYIKQNIEAVHCCGACLFESQLYAYLPT